MVSLYDHPLKIGDISSKLPIVQGGMGVGVSLHRLAGTVANNGAIGVIAVADIGNREKDFRKDPLSANTRALRKEIKLAREIARGGVIGINMMVAMGIKDYHCLVTTAVEEEIDLIFSGGGIPTDLPRNVPLGSKTKLIPIVSSAKVALLITKKWFRSFKRVPDAVVLEGPMAGGHLGFKHEQIYHRDFTLEKLLPDVINTLNFFTKEQGLPTIPVIAAGGVYTGADIKKMLYLGASGVQMGTRFVATDECDVHENFKMAYVNAQKPDTPDEGSDIVIIESPVGMLGRAIDNQFLRQAKEGKQKPRSCPYRCIRGCEFKKISYCISKALINAQNGNFDNGFTFCGTNAYRVTDIISVSKLITSLNEEFQNA